MDFTSRPLFSYRQRAIYLIFRLQRAPLEYQSILMVEIIVSAIEKAYNIERYDKLFWVPRLNQLAIVVFK